jgi:hypothetical protein
VTAMARTASMQGLREKAAKRSRRRRLRCDGRARGARAGLEPRRCSREPGFCPLLTADYTIAAVAEGARCA